MNKEIIFSEPLEKAARFNQFEGQLSDSLANFSRDKQHAEALLAQPLKLSDKDETRLKTLVKACEEAMAKLQTDKDMTEVAIQEMYRQHAEYKEILDKFVPTIEH